MDHEKPFLATLQGQSSAAPSFWFMRQAGRYLPEYMAIRKDAGGFLDLVYNPAFATEVTIQPLRRFHMDAAILFSDILVIPHALGVDVKFVKGEGPKLEAIKESQDIPVYSETKLHEVLSPIYETVSGIREALVNENLEKTTLIGFAGSPWTVACYMIDGGGSRDFLETKKWAYGRCEDFQNLIDILVEATADYLTEQVKAGAEVLQLFDSWSGILNNEGFERWVIQPTKAIIDRLRARDVNVPIIGFPRGAGPKYHSYVDQTGVNAVSVDQFMSLEQVKDLQKKIIVQGNLDPAYLLIGGETMLNRVETIHDALKDRPYIFNLGHGVVKETPPEHVEALSHYLKGLK